MQLNSTQLYSYIIWYFSVQCILTLLTVINDMSLIECHSFNTENYFDNVFLKLFFFSFSFSFNGTFFDLTIYAVCVCCVTHFIHSLWFIFITPSPHFTIRTSCFFLVTIGNRQFGFHWFSLCGRAYSNVRINFPHHLVDLILNQIQWEKVHFNAITMAANPQDNLAYYRLKLFLGIVCVFINSHFF